MGSRNVQMYHLRETREFRLLASNVLWFRWCGYVYDDEFGTYDLSTLLHNLSMAGGMAQARREVLEQPVQVAIDGFGLGQYWRESDAGLMARVDDDLTGVSVTIFEWNKNSGKVGDYINLNLDAFDRLVAFVSARRVWLADKKRQGR